MIAPRDEVEHASFAEHGGRNALRRSAGSDSPLDFSVCLNASGPSDDVRNAILGAPIDEYPDPMSRAVRAVAAKHWHVSDQEIVFGAGSAELIHALCFAYVRPRDRVLIGAPGFGEYARAARLCGARVVNVPFDSDTAVAAAFVEQVSATQPRLVFVASPMNPTGELISEHILRRLADVCAENDSLLVVDQAYDAFTAHPVGGPALRGHTNVAHLRSLTKEHALAGVRAGFAIAPAPVVVAIEAVRIPWAASSAAQAPAIASFSPGPLQHVDRTTADLRSECARLIAECTALGWETSATSTHFFTTRVGDATRIRAKLLVDHNILVRDCTSFGLPEWVRIAARTPIENSRLIAALSIVSSRFARHATA